jgi:DNA polymerase-3 subunit delta'
MNFKEYLEKYQPFVYNTFFNAIKNSRVAQAYLIKGNEAAPVLECAKFLSKSLICDSEHEFACDSCLSCIRFEEGNYSDFKLLDANKQSIKVKDIEELQEFLSSSSLETKKKKIYIINLLENCNKETVNALLKTLEEPFPNTYAFITTQNESKILQTIISRCQVLNLLPNDKSYLIDELKVKGVELLDIELLSSIYSNINTILEMKESSIYSKCKQALLDSIHSLSKNNEYALFSAQTDIITNIKSKEEARLYLDLLSLLFKSTSNKTCISLLIRADIFLLTKPLLQVNVTTLSVVSLETTSNVPLSSL